MSDHPASFSVRFWAVVLILTLLFLCAMHLRNIARDTNAIRQSLERPAPKVETYEPIRRAYAAWAAVKDSDTSDAYYWATKNLIDTLKAHRTAIERPALENSK